MANNNKVRISQNIKMIALVTKGESKTVTTQKGDKEILELTLRTPEGAMVKVSNWVRESDNDFVIQKTDELRAIIAEVTGDTKTGSKVYISKNIYMNKDDVQFDWFTSEETDEGNVYHQVEGFVDRQFMKSLKMEIWFLMKSLELNMLINLRI